MPKPIINNITGVKGILANMKTAVGQTGKGIQRGIKRAGLFLQRESQKIVPVDTSTLKNSAFTRTKGAGFATVATVGYTTEYAIFVHEDLEANHKPGKQAKYLSQPLADHRQEILNIIWAEAHL